MDHVCVWVCVQGDGYKDHYYQSKLGLAPGDEQARRQVAQSYLEGAYINIYK